MIKLIVICLMNKEVFIVLFGKEHRLIFYANSTTYEYNYMIISYIIVSKILEIILLIVSLKIFNIKLKKVSRVFINKEITVSIFGNWGTMLSVEDITENDLITNYR